MLSTSPFIHIKDEDEHPYSLKNSSSCSILLCVGFILTVIMTMYITTLMNKESSSSSVTSTTLLNDNNLKSSMITLSNNDEPIVLSRIVHLISVATQEEAYRFINNHLLPSITSDVIFNCWGEICHDPRTGMSPIVYVGQWNSHLNYRRTFKGHIQSFDRKKDTLFTTSKQEGWNLGFWHIQPSIYFINELSLNLSRHTTLTESRNRLAAFVSEQERIQGWKWAYVNIMDGDGRLSCPSLLHTSQDPSWKYQSNQWKELIPQTQKESSELGCWLAFNSFLLTVGPGIGVPMFHEPHNDWIGGTMTFHFDGVIVAFHHTLFPIMHPLCEKFDPYSYWSSQAYLIVQSICLLGHVFTNNYFQAINPDHRTYPRQSPFAPFTDEVIKELNIIPERLLYISQYLKDGQSYKYHLTPLISFDFYDGFNYEKMIPNDCRTHMIDVKTCIRTQ
jgi:hypothetical protein